MSVRYLGRKVLGAIVTIFFIIVLNFVLFRMMPGSPERVLLRNPYLTQEKIEAVREQWGLNDPLLPISISLDPPAISVNPANQLFGYVQSTLTGDLGYSFKFRGQPVTEVIGSRFWPTIILIGAAEAIAIVVGLALGSYAGWRRGGKVDRAGSGVSLILYSMPYFVIGTPLIIIFAAGLGWAGLFTSCATPAANWPRAASRSDPWSAPRATVARGRNRWWRKSSSWSIGEAYVAPIVNIPEVGNQPRPAAKMMIRGIPITK